jgi:4'-phosphopantetheinyl transferase
MSPIDIDIHVIDMDCADVDLKQLATFLSDEETARCARLRYDRDRYRYVVRRGQLREALSGYLGCSPSRVPLGYHALGKPLVDGTDLRFNVSHSRNIALFAIARGLELGCDIEMLDSSFAYDKIPERFFSAYEVGAWRDLDPTARLEGFFNCWTRKEAYLKARGFGLSVSLDSFDVSLAPGVPAALLRGCDGWSVQSFSPAAGFQAAVVAEATDWRLNFQSNDGQSGQITGNG